MKLRKLENEALFKRRLIQAALLCGAAFFIVAGIARGDAPALWRKAVFVCLECIGIG